MRHSGVPTIVLRDDEEVYVTLKSLIMELDRDDSMENLLVQNLYMQLLIRVSRLFCESRDQTQGHGVIHVKKALRYIHQHYDRDIHIRDIAEAVNVHPGYLHRIFKSSKGCTINEYLVRVRMEKAKSLLSNTDIKITDISGYVGINSRQYFAAAFKNYTGLSPSQYRKTSVKSAIKY
jgi:YesN/AraC family two-component response regulator